VLRRPLDGGAGASVAEADREAPTSLPTSAFDSC
jgi:hypothetical protein